MRFVVLALVSLAGCDLYLGHRAPTVDAAAPLPPLLPTDELDVLFVLNNSASTADKQAVFSVDLPKFVAALDNFPNGRPDLHIGFTSTSVSIGASGFGANCANGDDGLLQSTARQSACSAPTGRFISDGVTPNGRVTNYPPSEGLATAMSCIAALGTGGCGFIAPLEATKRALDGSHSENAGFLRDKAALLVVMLVPKDDCSASPGLFGLTVGSTAVNNSDFRCAVYGYACDQPISATEPGTYTGCRPRVGGYLHDVADYVTFLTSIKDPRRIGVVAIAGDPSTTITTGAITSPFSQQLGVLPSCSATINGNENIARPADRLADFVARLSATGAEAEVSTICTSDYASAFTDAARMALATMER